MRSQPGQGSRRGPRRVLDAVAWFRALGIDPVDRRRVAAIAGFTPNGSTLRNYAAELIRKGYLEIDGPGSLRATPLGLSHATATEIGATTIVAEVRRQLSPAIERMFDAIVEAHPEPIERSDLASKLGLEPGGSTLRNYVAALTGPGFAEIPGPGQVRAPDWLFIADRRPSPKRSKRS